MSKKPEYPFDRLTVPEPEPVGVRKTSPVNFISVWNSVLGVILAITILTWLHASGPAAQTYPEAGPSAVFGQTTSPEPAPCPTCTCPDCSWLSRFVGALDDANASPREIRDVLHRSYTESRFSETAVSTGGDYGICQINRAAHPEVDVDRLLVDPVYAAGECLRVYRGVYAACGDHWQCCYRRGVQGCAGRDKNHD